jgi:hypothetical protein
VKPTFFPEKDPEEILTLTFDFSADLAGETINGAPVVSVAAYSGTDAAPGDVLNGAAQLDGTSTKVLQSVKAGLADVDYRVKVKVTTAGGRTLAMARILPVRNA